MISSIVYKGLPTVSTYSIFFSVLLSFYVNGYVLAPSFIGSRGESFLNLHTKSIRETKDICLQYATTIDNVKAELPSNLKVGQEGKIGRNYSSKQPRQTNSTQSNIASSKSNSKKKDVSRRKLSQKVGNAKKNHAQPSLTTKSGSSNNKAPKRTDGKRQKNGATKSDASGSKSSKPTTKNNRPKKKVSNLNDRRKPVTELKVGSVFNGCEVMLLCSYGAYIKINGYAIKGAGALLHKSKIRKEKVDDISSVLSVGQKLDYVRIIKADAETAEVGVSIRVAERCLLKDLFQTSIGEMFSGRVTSIENYGAFVDIGCKKRKALLHKSRITSNERVDDVSTVLKVGDMIQVRLIHVDVENNTMEVSMLSEQSDTYLDWRQARQSKTKKHCELTEAIAMSFVADHLKEVEMDSKTELLGLFDGNSGNIEGNTKVGP